MGATGGRAFQRKTLLFKGKSGGFGPFNRFPDQAPRFLGTAPADEFHPFAGFQVFVVLKEMLDLLNGDARQIRVFMHMDIALGQLG